jgi:hypothetical protein
MAPVPNTLRINSSQWCLVPHWPWLLLDRWSPIILYAYRGMLHYVSCPLGRCGFCPTQYLTPLWPKLILPASQYLVPYCFRQLRMSHAFVAKTAFAGYAMSRDDRFCQLMMSCSFMAKCFSEVIAWCYRPNIHTQDSWHSHPIILYNLIYVILWDIC